MATFSSQYVIGDRVFIACSNNIDIGCAFRWYSAIVANVYNNYVRVKHNNITYNEMSEIVFRACYIKKCI